MPNEELYDLYSSLNVIRVIRSMRMGLAGHVSRMGKDGVLVRKP